MTSRRVPPLRVRSNPAAEPVPVNPSIYKCRHTDNQHQITPQQQHITTQPRRTVLPNTAPFAHDTNSVTPHNTDEDAYPLLSLLSRLAQLAQRLNALLLNGGQGCILGVTAQPLNVLHSLHRPAIAQHTHE